MNKLFQCFFLSTLLCFASCATKRPLVGNAYTLTKRDIVSIKANWIKTKGLKFDVDFIVTNLYNDGIIFSSQTVVCGKGDTEGEISNFSASNIGIGKGIVSMNNSTWPITISGKRGLFLTCLLPSADIPGDFYISIGKIHHNPKNDMNTIGNIITSDLKIVIPEEKKSL